VWGDGGFREKISKGSTKVPGGRSSKRNLDARERVLALGNERITIEADDGNNEGREGKNSRHRPDLAATSDRGGQRVQKLPLERGV